MAAGRLFHFKEAWEQLTDSPFVLQATDGYLLEPRAQPPFMSHREAAFLETLFRGQKESVVDEEVRGVMEKGVVAQSPSGAGFYSRFVLFCFVGFFFLFFFWFQRKTDGCAQ